jgi:hypothetical protein
MIGATPIVFVDKPVLQEYVFAPLAVNEVVWPEQMIDEFTVTVGNGFTTTVVIVKPEQAPVSPITEKVEVFAGDITIEEPTDPLFHVYVVAPVVVNVAVWPIQMVGLFTVNDKFALMVILAVAVFTQPNKSPVTV